MDKFVITAGRMTELVSFGVLVARGEGTVVAAYQDGINFSAVC